MANPKVRQFAGDFRMWRKASNGDLLPVIPEPSDPYGNQPIETDAFNFGYEAGEEVLVASKRRDNRYNQPIHSDQLPGVTSLSITLLEMPTAILAAVLRADVASSVIGTGDVVEEPFTVTAADAPLQLPHRYITSLVVEKGVTPLAAGVDYVDDPVLLRRGQVMPVQGGAIEAGDTLAISYSHPTLNMDVFDGGAVPIQPFYITGDMQDRISGEEGDLTVYEARLGVEDDIDWLSAEPLSPVLTGNLIVPAGAPAPYRFVAYRQGA